MKPRLVILALIMIALFAISVQAFSIRQIRGDVTLYNSNSQIWEKVTEESELQLETMLCIGQNSRLTVRSDEGDVVIPGPFQGMLGRLLSDDSKYTSNELQSVFNKIPSPRQGDKKIELTVQSAAAVKGTKTDLKKIPYRWRSSSDSNLTQ